ncbi:hypothetical protein, partial [Pseudanabaena sp. 'Roaring Creek']|uniref:hypothetical protein n=1 Tax=Pseudanabaena sp. 'Roaring Creek' TaxID=1681830 RepID=UPI000B20A21D
KPQRELPRGARQLSLGFYVLMQLAAAITYQEENSSASRRYSLRTSGDSSYAMSRWLDGDRRLTLPQTWLLFPNAVGSL